MFRLRSSPPNSKWYRNVPLSVKKQNLATNTQFWKIVISSICHTLSLFFTLSFFRAVLRILKLATLLKTVSVKRLLHRSALLPTSKAYKAYSKDTQDNINCKDTCNNCKNIFHAFSYCICRDPSDTNEMCVLIINLSIFPICRDR